MRTNNVRCNIVAPSFVNQTLYDGGYRLTVSLNISEEIYAHLCNLFNGSITVFRYQGKYYIHWEKSYRYDTAFAAAYVEAAKALRQLQIIVRQAKIELLEKEIDNLKHPEELHVYGNYVEDEDIELPF